MRITKITLNKIRWILGHPAFQKHPLRVAWGALKWEIIRLRGKETQLRLPSGALIRVAPHDGIGRLVAYFGQHDHSLLKFLSTVLRRGDTFVDVGANIGTISIHAASVVSNTGKVIAYEPNPDVFERLRLNTKSFGAVECRQIAVGQIDSAVEFSLNVDTAKSRVFSQGGHFHNDTEKVISVVARRLDTEIFEHIRVLKVDVEGHDLDVLVGAEKLLLDQKIDFIVAEATENKKELVSFLEKHGFAVFALCDEGRIRQEPVWFEASENVVAVSSRNGLLEAIRADGLTS